MNTSAASLPRILSPRCEKVCAMGFVVIAENFLLLPVQNDKIVLHGLKFARGVWRWHYKCMCPHCLVNTQLAGAFYSTYAFFINLCSWPTEKHGWKTILLTVDRICITDQTFPCFLFFASRNNCGVNVIEKKFSSIDSIPRCNFYVNIIKWSNYESFVCQKRKKRERGSEYSSCPVAFYFERTCSFRKVSLKRGIDFAGWKCKTLSGFISFFAESLKFHGTSSIPSLSSLTVHLFVPLFAIHNVLFNARRLFRSAAVFAADPAICLNYCATKSCRAH